MFDNLDEKNKEGINLLPDNKKRSRDILGNSGEQSFKRDIPLHIPNDEIKKVHLAQDKRSVPRPSKLTSGKKTSVGFFSFLNKFRRLKKEKETKSLLSVKLPVKSIVAAKSFQPGTAANQDLGQLAKQLDDKPLPKPIDSQPNIASGQAQEKIIPKTVVDHPAKTAPLATLMHISNSQLAKSDEDKEFDVNLLPEEKKLPTAKKALTSYVFAAVLALAVIVPPCIIFRAKTAAYNKEIDLLASRTEVVNKKIKTTEEAISGLGTIVKKLEHIESLLRGHIYWSEFLPTLEQHTVAGVFFTSLSAGEGLAVSLQGRALDLRSLAEQLVVFRKSSIYHDIELASMRLGNEANDKQQSDQVEFTITFTLDSAVINAINAADSATQ